MRVWCVVFHCTVVGFYSSAVDAECVVRALQRDGLNASVHDGRLNAETVTGQQLLQRPS